jgi:hypothetical protein
MKFAFLIMGDCFDAAHDTAAICNGTARIIGVRDLAQACETARRMQAEGVSCIELCGAFGPQGAQAVIEATQGSVAVGYVTHLSQQDALFKALFGE